MKLALGFVLCAATCLTACAAPDPARRPREVAAPPRPAPTLEEQAAEAVRASQPRNEHRSLQALVGTWNTSVVTVTADGVESDPRTGFAAIEWVLGGRYLKWEATLEIGAAVHATTGYLGFDVNQGEYQLLMISDLATGMGVARGVGDVRETGIKFVLEITEPGSGAVRRAVSTLRASGRDHFVLEQVGSNGAGGERVVRRTHYRRAAGQVTK